MSYVAAGYPRLSYAQLEQVWIKAGGPKKIAGLMAAIALAESGGIAGNTNPTDNNGTQTAFGLWQISNGTHAWTYAGDPYDPLNNARIAVMKYHSQGLHAWGTYTSGAYRKYLQGDVPPGTGDILTGSGGNSNGGSGGGDVILTASQQGFATFAGFNETPDLNPVHAVESVVGDVGGLAKGAFGWAEGVVKSGPDALKAISKGIGVIAEIFAGFLWLLNPANDLRVISGIVGLIVLMIGLYLVATA